MRYTININQLAVINNNLDIDFEEAVILDYIYWLCKSENTKMVRIKDGEDEYTWFDYGYFLRQNPMIKWKSKASLTSKLGELEKKGFFKTKLVGDYLQKKYISVLSKIELMYSDKDLPIQKTKRVVQKTKRTPIQKTKQDNNTTIYNNTNDNSSSVLKDAETELNKQINDIIYTFKNINPNYKSLFVMKAQKEAAKWLIDKYGYEKAKDLVEFLETSNKEEFCPKATTPYALQVKLGDISAYWGSKNNKSKSISI
jgi:hypothetical protein